MKPLIFGLATVLCMATLATADELWVEIVPQSMSIHLPKVELQARGLTLVAGRNGMSTVTWTDPAAVSTLLSVEVDSPSSGVANFELQFDLPYFWTNPAHIKPTDGVPPALTAALVADEFERGDYSALSAAFNKPNGTLPELTLVNQMGRQAYKSVMQALQNPARIIKREDAQIVFIFAQTSKELVVNYYVQPDEDMLAAMNWLRLQLSNTAQASRLFPMESQLADAKKVLAEFDDYEVVRFKRSVLRIEKDIKDYPEDRLTLCQKALRVDRDYGDDDQDMDMAPETAMPMSYRMKNLTNVLECLQREISDTARTDTVALVDKAELVLPKMAEWIVTYSAVQDANQAVLRYASRAHDNLQGILAARRDTLATQVSASQ